MRGWETEPAISDSSSSREIKIFPAHGLRGVSLPAAKKFRIDRTESDTSAADSRTVKNGFRSIGTVGPVSAAEGGEAASSMRHLSMYRVCRSYRVARKKAALTLVGQNAAWGFQCRNVRVSTGLTGKILAVEQPLSSVAIVHGLVLAMLGAVATSLTLRPAGDETA